MKRKEIALQILKEVSLIAQSIQNGIVADFNLNKLTTSVGFDFNRDLIYLRCEIAISEENEKVRLFENDILSIKIENGYLFFDSILYSEYGIEKIFSLTVKIDEIEKEYFSIIETKLLEGIKEHLMFYL